MNIAIINQWYPPKSYGGVAKYNYYIANAYKKLGNNVFIISKLPKENKKHSFIDRIHIFYVKQLDIHYFFYKIPYLGGFLRILRDLIYSFRVRSELIKLDKKYKIDIVEYAEINYEGFAHSIFGPKKIPFIVRCHTPYFVLKKYYLRKEFRFDNPLLYLLERIFIKNAPYITTPSKNLADVITKELKISKENIKVIPNAIDIDKFNIQKDNKINKETILLFVGRLERAKGIFVLAESFCELVKIYKEKVKCIFVGKDRGGLLKLKEIFTENKIIERVEFKGEVKEKELINIYNICDIFINPSLIYESFSYTCLEAMAAGKPVVASKIGGIPEVVEDGKTGFLFEVGNIRELVNKLCLLIDNPQQRKIMGENARRRVEENFDVLKIAKINLLIYDKVKNIC